MFAATLSHSQGHTTNRSIFLLLVFTAWIYALPVQGQETPSNTLQLTEIGDLKFFIGQEVNHSLGHSTGGSGFPEYTLQTRFGEDLASSNGVSEYVLTDDGLDGLKYDADTQSITGTLIGNTQGATLPARLGYKVVDEAGNEDFEVFTMNIVNLQPSFGGQNSFTAAVVQYEPLFMRLPEINVIGQTSGVDTATMTSYRGSLSVEITTDSGSPTRLPNFIEYHPAINRLVGVPTVLSGPTIYNIKVTDTDGDNATLTLTFSVTEDAITPPTISPIIVQVGGVGVNQVLPVFTGGTGTLTYTLVDEEEIEITNSRLAAVGLTGLAYDSTTRTFIGSLAGTSSIDTESFTFTYSATDESGVTASTLVELMVEDSIPRFDEALATIALEAKVGVYFSRFLPSVVSGTGDGTVRYTLQEPGFGSNISFRTSRVFGTNVLRGELYGVPSSAGQRQTRTYTATDLDGDTATLSISLQVIESELNSPTIPDYEITVQKSFTEVLPAFTGGSRPYTYSLLDENGDEVTDFTGKFSGLKYVPATHTIRGTITGTGENDSTDDPKLFKLCAVDALGDTASRLFSLTVVDAQPSFGNQDQEDESISLVKDYGFSLTLPEVTNTGSGTVTYSISPNLPNGVGFRSSDRMLSGTPRAEQSETQYTYIAADIDGDIVSLQFTLEVLENTAPRAPSREDVTYVFTLGQDFSVNSVTLPAFMNGNEPLMYSFTHNGDEVTTSTPLIGGIGYDPGERSFSGIVSEPTGTNRSAQYVYAVSDADSQFASTIVTITIGSALAFAADERIDDIIAVQDFALSTEPLPEVDSLGTGDITYTITPDLPAGLDFNAETRILAGTATVLQRATPYTYKATDSNRVSAILNFNLAVEEDTLPIAPANASFRFEPGQQVSVQLPEFTGGNAPFTYSITKIRSGTPSFVRGLNIDAETQTIKGRVHGIPGVDDSVPTITYTYTVTDANNDTASSLIWVWVRDEVPDLGGYRIVHLHFENSYECSSFNSYFNYCAGYTSVTPDPVVLPAITSRTLTVSYSIEPRYNSHTTARFTPSTRELHYSRPYGHGFWYEYNIVDLEGDRYRQYFTVTFQRNNPPPIQAPCFCGFKPIDEVEYFSLTPPTVEEVMAMSGKAVTPQILPAFEYDGPYRLTYSTTGLPTGLDFTLATRMLSGTTGAIGVNTITYTAVDEVGNTASTTFTLTVMDSMLTDATRSAIPAVSTSVAMAATASVSSRISQALSGATKGVDITTAAGQRFQFDPSSSKSGSRSGRDPLRFGFWYNTATDDLSDTRYDISTNSTTESSNFGFDISLDFNADTTLVLGVMQNNSATETEFRNIGSIGRDDSGSLALDLSSTALYAALGWRWLNVWAASGDNNTQVAGAESDVGLPASFSYQTIGLSADLEVWEDLHIGAKVETLQSNFSVPGQGRQLLGDLASVASHTKATLTVNYELEMGRESNGLLIPRFEFGTRDLSTSEQFQTTRSNARDTASELGFGLDYKQLDWGLTLGLDVHSMTVQNYASESVQWSVRWESGHYGKGLSLSLTPTTVAQTLGVDNIYNGDYGSYKSLVNRQFSDDSAVSGEGVNVEMGVGLLSGSGTFTPFVRATNLYGSGATTQAFGVRYSTPVSTSFELKFTQQARSRSASNSLTTGVASSVRPELKQALEFSTRYSF